MKEKSRHPGQKAEVPKQNPSSFADDEVARLVNTKKNTRELLYVTSAAVNALSSSGDASDGKEPDLKDGSDPRSLSARSPLDAEVWRGGRPTKPQHSARITSPASTIVENVPGDHLLSDKDSCFVSRGPRSGQHVPAHTGMTSREDLNGSSLEQSFNGTHRVKISSKMLREITSPSDRSWSSNKSLESSDSGQARGINSFL